MCLIIYKPKNVNLPQEKLLENAFINNPDGAGLMYIAGSDVIIDKGFMNYDCFLKNYKKVANKKDAIVMHFRQATHGTVCPENCHPFPLSKTESDLLQTQFITNVGVCHNGVIDIESDLKSTLSDTQIFIKNILAHVDINNKQVIKLLKYVGGRFLILTKNRIYVTGNWIKDNEIYYSNDSYKVQAYSWLHGIDKQYKYSYKQNDDTMWLDYSEYYQNYYLGEY